MIKVDANAILSASKPGDIFSNDPIKIKEECRNLRKMWHPDTNKDSRATEVFAKITSLYELGLEMIERGEWEKTNAVIINREDGKRFELTYLSSKDFELGTTYICRKVLAYRINGTHEKFYRNAVKQIDFKYKDEGMRKEFSRCLPDIIDHFKDKTGDYWLIMRKTEDVFCLEDILAFYKGRIPDRHVAWIVSRISNLACYLQHSHKVHNGISIRNCYISPKYHSVLLLGGWWYATDKGEKMIGTVKEVFNIMPLSVRNTKKSHIKTDLESIKLLARTLLGSKSGIGFKKDIQIPAAFETFITDSSVGDAYKEFSLWSDTLDKAYGERKFIEMAISEKDIYQ